MVAKQTWDSKLSESAQGDVANVVSEPEAGYEAAASASDDYGSHGAGEDKLKSSSYLGMSRDLNEADKGLPRASRSDDAAPLSSALGISTVLKDSDGPNSNTGNAYFTSNWLPLLLDNPTPLSTALGLPVLLNDSRRAGTD